MAVERLVLWGTLTSGGIEMTIDTKELRRLAQAATPGPWYAGNGAYEGRNIYSVVSVTDAEGFTYQPVVHFILKK